MIGKPINYSLIIVCLSLTFGCGIKNKGEIVLERHKRMNDFYLENTSSDKIIIFTVRKKNKLSSETKYFVSKKNISDTDSTSSTSVYTLAPGERKYLGRAQNSDTLKLDKDPYDTFVSLVDSTASEGYIPPPKGIHVTNIKSSFKIVGASLK